ncbi:MAG: hypothetical protein ACYDH4_11060 [Candidatus Cryosericum sp.]|jgi:hypothetical protein
MTALRRIELDRHKKQTGSPGSDAMAPGVPGPDKEEVVAMASNERGPEGPDAMASVVSGAGGLT